MSYHSGEGRHWKNWRQDKVTCVSSHLSSIPPPWTFRHIWTISFCCWEPSWQREKSHARNVTMVTDEVLLLLRRVVTAAIVILLVLVLLWWGMRAAICVGMTKIALSPPKPDASPASQ